MLLSFIKGEDNITLPNLTNEALEDALIDKKELIDACAEVLQSLNANSKDQIIETLNKNFETPIHVLPEASQIDTLRTIKLTSILEVYWGYSGHKRKALSQIYPGCWIVLRNLILTILR